MDWSMADEKYILRASRNRKEKRKMNKRKWWYFERIYRFGRFYLTVNCDDLFNVPYYAEALCRIYLLYTNNTLGVI